MKTRVFLPRRSLAGYPLGLRWRSQLLPPRGFTLIEVMMAGAIFLLVISGVLTSYNIAGRQFRTLEEQSQALHVGDGVVEDLVLAAGAATTLDPAGNPHVLKYDTEGNVSATGKFTATWNINDNVPVIGLRQIVLKVSWTDEITHTITLTTVRQ